MIINSIHRILRRGNLSEKEMMDVMIEIMNGKATPSQIGSFLTALRMKGETVEEIIGAVKAFRSELQTIHLHLPILGFDRDDINIEDETILEMSDNRYNGTRTFNISTASIFVVAAAGIPVVRYGSRFTSSYFGASDVLEHLGIKLDITRSDIEKCIHDIGVCFIFTPLFQGPMKCVASIREEIGIRTIFNMIGPLMNPVNASSHILGVYDQYQTEKMASVFNRLGTKSAIVLYGSETIDEISICGPSRISHLKNGNITTYIIEPEDFGFTRSNRDAIRGGNAIENANIIRQVLNGDTGPKRNVVILNAAAAFVAAGSTDDINQGVEMATEMIDSGKARKKMEDLISFTSKCGHFVRKDL